MAPSTFTSGAISQQRWDDGGLVAPRAPLKDFFLGNKGEVMVKGNGSHLPVFVVPMSTPTTRRSSLFIM
ncbi:Ras family GTPase [Aspergillus luchuensis]|uniref:Ras family GTPase n=1 Tax=Aspergillus kawachii TaxID=1069201 RepID=A0A146F406_ASPKA|nr:Ras family GTPase [Aspergillus luchuensis]